MPPTPAIISIRPLGITAARNAEKGGVMTNMAQLQLGAPAASTELTEKIAAGPPPCCFQPKKAKLMPFRLSNRMGKATISPSHFCGNA